MEQDEEKQVEQSTPDTETPAPAETEHEDLEDKYHVQVINLLQELCDLLKASVKVETEDVEQVTEDAEDDAEAFDELLD